MKHNKTNIETTNWNQNSRKHTQFLHSEVRRASHMSPDARPRVFRLLPPEKNLRAAESLRNKVINITTVFVSLISHRRNCWQGNFVNGWLRRSTRSLIRSSRYFQPSSDADCQILFKFGSVVSNDVFYVCTKNEPTYTSGWFAAKRTRTPGVGGDDAYFHPSSDADCQILFKFSSVVDNHVFFICAKYEVNYTSGWCAANQKHTF